jgi:hypothetical protein
MAAAFRIFAGETIATPAQTTGKPSATAAALTPKTPLVVLCSVGSAFSTSFLHCEHTAKRALRTIPRYRETLANATRLVQMQQVRCSENSRV